MGNGRTGPWTVPMEHRGGCRWERSPILASDMASAIGFAAIARVGFKCLRWTALGENKMKLPARVRQEFRQRKAAVTEASSAIALPPIAGRSDVSPTNLVCKQFVRQNGCRRQTTELSMVPPQWHCFPVSRCRAKPIKIR